MRRPFLGETQSGNLSSGLHGRLDLLQSIIAIWSDTHTLPDAAPRVLDAVCETLDWDVGSIWLVDGEAGALRCVVARDRSKSHRKFTDLSMTLSFGRGLGLPGRVWAGASPDWIEDLPDDPASPRFAVARHEGLRSAFAFPIVSTAGVLGVLEFFSRELRPRDDGLLALMSAVGSYAGLFVERMMSEDALRRREAEYRTLADSLPAIVCRADADGRLTYFNRRWFDYTGIPPGEMSAETIRSAIHPDDQDRIAEAWRGAIASRTGYTVEYRLRRADGAYRWHLGQIVPVRDQQAGTSWVTSNVDIDDRKRAESAAQFLLDAGDALASSLDYETTLSNVTRLAVPAIADLCSVDLLEPDGSFVRVALTCVDPAQQTVFDAMPAHFSPDPAGAHPARRVLRSGRAECLPEVTDEVLAQVARDEDHLRLLRELAVRSAIAAPLIAHGRKYGTMLFVTTSSGRTYGADDRRLAEALAGRAAFAIDNARLYRDSQALAADLQMANAAKDAFLSLVSHELRTPLTTILGNAEVLERASVRMTEADRRGAIADVGSDARRLARIIDNMLTLARLDRDHPAEREPVLLGRVIGTAAARHHERFPRRLLHIQIGDALPVAEGNAEHIDQILENLLTNAEKYGDADKPITVEARVEGTSVIVSVVDEGRGVGPEDARRIFEPFERGTRHASVQGLGVGLAVCKRLAEAQGGRIWAEPRTGGGSVFSFTLAIASEPEE
jgi:PAS domain S-box-containing protein